MVPTQVTTSSVFQSYEEDFHRLQRTVRDKVAAASAKAGGSSASRISAGRAVSEAHAQASQAFQQLELEAKSMGSLGSSIQGKLKDYRSDLAFTRQQTRECVACLNREGLGLHGAELATEDQKTAADTCNRLRGSSRRIDQARRTALEAEEIGMDVMTDLHSQRESIMRTKVHMHDNDENLNIAKQILVSLNNRAVVNQLTVGLIGFVLLITVCVVIYLKFEKLLQRLR